MLPLSSNAPRSSKSLQPAVRDINCKFMSYVGVKMATCHLAVNMQRCKRVHAQQQHNSGSSGSSSSSGAADTQQDISRLLLLQQQPQQQLPNPLVDDGNDRSGAPKELEQPLAMAEEQLEHALSCKEGIPIPHPTSNDSSPTTPSAISAPQGSQGDEFGPSMQADMAAEQQPHWLSTLLLGCARADVTPSLKWVRSTLTALIESLEKNTPTAPAGSDASEQQQGALQLTGPHEKALMQLPHVMDLVLSYGTGQALRQLCARGVLLVDRMVPHMAHQDLLHLLRALVHLQQEDAADQQQQGEEWQRHKQGLVTAVLQRMQQLSWEPQEVGCLVNSLTCLSQLAAAAPTPWLALCFRHMGQATLETTLTAQHVLDLASVLRNSSIAYSQTSHQESPNSTTKGGNRAPDGNYGRRHTGAADCWLLWWLETTAQAVLVRDVPSMTTPQLLSAAKLLSDIHTSAESCPAAFEAASVFNDSGFSSPEDEDGMCLLETVPGWAPEQVVLQEVERRLDSMPPHELVQHTALLLTASLPQSHLSQLLDACLPRLYFMLGDVQASDAASLLQALAQCQLPDLQRVQPLARALAESTCPLLPSCPLPDLVQLLSAMAVLDVRPSITWQDAYFHTLRTRLPLFGADELIDILACMDALGLKPTDEKWTDRIFLLSRKLLEDMSAAQVADLVWWLSHHAVCMEWTWVPGYELVSRPQLKDLSPALLAVSIKGLTKLGFTPGARWLAEFLDAVEARLFAPSAMHPCIISVEEGSQLSLDRLMTHRMAARIRRRCLKSATGDGKTSMVESQLILDDEGGGSATVDVLTSLVDAMNYCRVTPSQGWMASFCDAVRCKMSLLKADERVALLTFMAAVAHRPEQHWWDDYLGLIRREELCSMNLSTQVTILSLLHSLDVRPSDEWLDGWCAVCQEKLCMLLPQQLIQVVSCMAACNYTPPLPWLMNLGTAIEHAARTMVFEPHELVRCVVILDKMGLSLTPGLLAILYSDMGQAGLRLLEPHVLVQMLWILQSVPEPPSDEWLSSYVAAAQRHLPSLTTMQVETLVSGIMAVCAAQHQPSGVAAGAASHEAAPQLPSYVNSFRVLAREFMV